MTTKPKDSKTRGVSFPKGLTERITERAGKGRFSQWVSDACIQRLKRERKKAE